MQPFWNGSPPTNSNDGMGFDLDKFFEMEPTDEPAQPSFVPTPIPTFEAPLSALSNEPYTAVHLTESQQMAIFLESLGLPTPMPEIDVQLSAEEFTALCNEATNTPCVVSDPHFLTDSATDLVFLQNSTLSSPLSDATPINAQPVPGLELPIRKKITNLKEDEKLAVNRTRIRLAIQYIDTIANLTFTQLVKKLHTALGLTERQVRGLFTKWHKEQPSNPDILRIITFKARSVNARIEKIEKIRSGIDFLNTNRHLTQKEAKQELARQWKITPKNARKVYFKVCEEHPENETMRTFTLLLSSLPKKT